MDTSAFDFELPDGLIAQQPAEPRDRSRLMVVSRAAGRVEHRTFADLPDLLGPGDVLVRNNTRVVPARLLGVRESTGGKWEGLFLREVGNEWEVLATTRGKPAEGERVAVRREEGSEDALSLLLVRRGEGGRWRVRPLHDDPAPALLGRFGHVPLPPYIRKGREGPDDRQRYQTLYATVPGAVAAPTAGLHFTQNVLDRLDARGVKTAEVTLHVGIGTFRPIEADRIEDHVLHAEWGSLPDETAATLNGPGIGRIVAVGTTSTRVLETAATRVEAGSNDRVSAFEGETALYLRPGHSFRAVDALVTNFHLPKSSLLVLVSAFAGYELTREAYAEAVRGRYRFYSYGDAMVIV